MTLCLHILNPTKLVYFKIMYACVNLQHYIKSYFFEKSWKGFRYWVVVNMFIPPPLANEFILILFMWSCNCTFKSYWQIVKTELCFLKIFLSFQEEIPVDEMIPGIGIK